MSVSVSVYRESSPQSGVGDFVAGVGCATGMALGMGDGCGEGIVEGPSVNRYE